MAETASHNRLKLWAMFSAAHVACTAILWVWSLGVAGLGFKDKDAWTVFDQFQATVIPVLTSVLTAPGRFVMTSDGWAGFVLPLLANSLLWGAVVTMIFLLMRRRPVG